MKRCKVIHSCRSLCSKPDFLQRAKPKAKATTMTTTIRTKRMIVRVFVLPISPHFSCLTSVESGTGPAQVFREVNCCQVCRTCCCTSCCFQASSTYRWQTSQSQDRCRCSTSSLTVPVYAAQAQAWLCVRSSSSTARVVDHVHMVASTICARSTSYVLHAFASCVSAARAGRACTMLVVIVFQLQIPHA